MNTQRPRALTIFGVALLLMTTAGTALPDGQQAQEETRPLLFGVNMVANAHALFYPEGYKRNVYETLQQVGSTMVRLAASMRDIEPVRGARDWSKFEEELSLALEHGMEPMILIVNTPLWALPEAINTLPEGMDPTYQYPYDEPFYPDFVDFLEELVERTRDKVTMYQLWNEQNGCSWHHHDGFNHAHEYVPFLDVTYRTVKAAYPESLVLLGSLDDAAGNGHIFLELTYEILANEYDKRRMFDGVTLHPYDYDIDNKEHKIRRIHAIMAENGDGDLPIYITEYGWRTGPERDHTKQLHLGETLEMYQKPSLDFLKGAIHLSLTDFEGEPGFGLMDENLRPYGSFHVFQGAPRFGASPPHTIEWLPLANGDIRLTWQTQLPATTTVRYWPDGEAAGASKTIETGGEGEALLEDLEPGRVYAFELETTTVDGARRYTSASYPFRVPDESVPNADFGEGFFGGIARHWRIDGPGLCTDAAVFPGLNREPGEHAQVLFSLPERDIRLDSRAHCWVRVEPGAAYRLQLDAMDGSLRGDVAISMRWGLDPNGGNDPNAAGLVWSDQQTLTPARQTLTLAPVEAQASLMTIWLQAWDSGKGSDRSRPAAVFENVRLERVE